MKYHIVVYKYNQIKIYIYIDILEFEILHQIGKSLKPHDVKFHISMLETPFQGGIRDILVLVMGRQASYPSASQQW